jgi:RNA polymerase sigma factor (sigma-70 family)
MQLEQIFNENQRFLWGLCYRMTGSAADADDILQETFVRLLQKPPANTDEPLRSWLMRVAVNLSREGFARRQEHRAGRRARDDSLARVAGAAHRSRGTSGRRDRKAPHQKADSA